MKIIVIGFLELDALPPAITLLKILSKKNKVFYIGIDDMNDRYRNIFGNNIKFYNIMPHIKKSNIPYIQKLNSFIFWRMYKYNLLKGGKILNKVYKKGDIVWVLHEYTLMHMGNVLGNIPYFLTMYELHPDIFKKKSKLKKMVKNASKVIVPEYARSAIVQACAGLADLPYVIPNKPYEFNEADIYLENNPLEKIVKQVHDKKKLIILYSGIFLRERKLDTILEAVNDLKDKYEMVLAGRESDYLKELLIKYPDVKYLGFTVPPKHLSIIKLADIGILTYVADSGSINPVFCAPNKIWEYAKYGIPMLCNDIPGLKYTVEYYRTGYCCDINSVNDIKEKLNNIYYNYEEFSKNAKTYYESIDVEKLVLDLLK
jgi:glycosyltransferase involved in cell wall biosynthesis